VISTQGAISYAVQTNHSNAHDEVIQNALPSLTKSNSSLKYTELQFHPVGGSGQILSEDQRLSKLKKKEQIRTSAGKTK
jgi:hypothetical protein